MKRPPPYAPTEYKKNRIIKNLTKAGAIELMGIDKETFDSWGDIIPFPYADRIFLSEWGELPFEPRFVLISDALIIFKSIAKLTDHFSLKKNELKDQIFLPEGESAYMIRKFPGFMRVFTESEIKDKYYR